MTRFASSLLIALCFSVTLPVAAQTESSTSADVAVTSETTSAATETASAATESEPVLAPATVAEEAPSEAPAASAPASDPDDEPVVAPASAREPEFGARASVDIGFLGVLAHEITLGRDGSRIDYPTDLAQSNLYLYLRVQGDFDIWRQHILTFVYQPIDITSDAVLARTLRIDGLDFAAGTPVRARYGFPFYRLGWAFDVLSDPREELAFGLGFQIRNATISFQSLDGTLYRARYDVGPVPLLRARGRFPIANDWFFAFEVDGFYAFIPGLNGSDNPVEGAILDASVRLGWRVVPHVDGYVSVRYLGGGAAGASDPEPTNDGFQRNWLHFLAISLGVTLDTRP